MIKKLLSLCLIAINFSNNISSMGQLPESIERFSTVSSINDLSSFTGKIIAFKTLFLFDAELYPHDYKLYKLASSDDCYGIINQELFFEVTMLRNKDAGSSTFSLYYYLDIHNKTALPDKKNKLEIRIPSIDELSKIKKALELKEAKFDYQSLFLDGQLDRIIYSTEQIIK